MEDTKEPIPGYRILDELGEGGFARVFLAEQVTLRRKVALKVMSPKLSEDIEYCERFLREGRTLARLGDHPDIVAIHDIGKVGRYYFMAMEYLSGSDLKSKIQPHGFQGDCGSVVKNVAKALEYAHRAGVVHRDIKPANVLFNENGNAVLSDFGISKTLSQNDATLTAVGAQMGTPSYMSPEQCRGDSEIDGRSDLYSLGVMFFEMLTGNKPYSGENYMATIAAHLQDPIPRLPDTAAIYQPLIDRLMAKRPSDRYATAGEFVNDLNKLASSAKDPNSIKNMMLAGLLAVFVVISGILGWTYHKSSRDDLPLDYAAVPSPGLSEEKHDKIQRMLDAGQMHEIVGRFVAPPGSNALDAYRMVLDEDPANEFAKAAINRLTEKHGDQ